MAEAIKKPEETLGDKPPKPSADQGTPKINEILKRKAELALEGLRDQSMGLGNVHIEGYKQGELAIGTLDEIRMRPLTWNENGGVIMYADADGRKFATPATGEARQLLNADGVFQKDEKIGIPKLNEGNAWGMNRAENGAFRQWRGLAVGARPVQELEEKDLIEKQRAAREKKAA